MIRIDDSLLEELGLAALPKEERDALLKHIYETLEIRVGMKLADRMSEQQLSEFERFIDGDNEYVEAYLDHHMPGWRESTDFQNTMKSAGESAAKNGATLNEAAVKSEFAALRWLETNFPDYKQVVAAELDVLKSEIKKDSDQITQAATQDAAIPQQPQDFAPQSPPQPDFGQAPPLPPQQSEDYKQNQQPPMAA